MWVHWVCWILWYLNKNHSTWFQRTLFGQNDCKTNRNWTVQGKLLHFHVSMTIKLPPLNSRQTKNGRGVVYLSRYFSLLSQGSLIHSMQNIFVLLIQHRTRKSKTIKLFISPLTWSSLFVRKGYAGVYYSIWEYKVPERQKPPQKTLLILTTWINPHIIHTVYN